MTVDEKDDPAPGRGARSLELRVTRQERQQLVSWAVAALKGGAPAKSLRAKIDKRPSPLATRFGLDAVERRIVELAYAVERAIVAADAARAKGGLTVERLRALLETSGDVDAALSPQRALRRHALVAVGAGGMPAAADVVRLAPGLAARLDGAPEPDGLWLGCSRVVPGARGDLPLRIAALLGELGGAPATLWTLDGCPRREAHELALGLARHLSRGVLVVDGELLAEAADAALLLACARREADCEGDVLMVCAAANLGERWRALLAPATADVAALVVLADAERTRDPVAAAPFAVRRLSLHPPAAPAAAAAPAARVEEKPAPVADGLDHIRQQAIRDAERALGVYRAPPPPPRAPVTPLSPRLEPKPVLSPPLPPRHEPPPVPSRLESPSVSSPSVSSRSVPSPSLSSQSVSSPSVSSVSVSSQSVPSRSVPSPSVSSQSVSSPSVSSQSVSSQSVSSQSVSSQSALSQSVSSRSVPSQSVPSPSVPSPSVPSPSVSSQSVPSQSVPASSPPVPAKKRSAKGAQFFGGETVDPPRRPTVSPMAPPPPSPASEGDGPPVAVAADAPPEELARIAATSPSAAQRIDLIHRLRTIKSGAVVAALRVNAASHHPGVRAAAEAAMAMIFGANWNAVRAIPKPVQPAPSDDKDRGPPGG